jgi:hypothetical protein
MKTNAKRRWVVAVLEQGDLHEKEDGNNSRTKIPT